jgi:hypothetical protein
LSRVALAVTILLLLSMLWMRRRQHGVAPVREQPHYGLDTMQRAYEILRRAPPRYLVRAQVPLSRSVSVPTRHPHTRWLIRAGRLNVDLLVSDSRLESAGI